jgi:hypothetical protein
VVRRVDRAGRVILVSEPEYAVVYAGKATHQAACADYNAHARGPTRRSRQDTQHRRDFEVEET